MRKLGQVGAIVIAAGSSAACGSDWPAAEAALTNVTRRGVEDYNTTLDKANLLPVGLATEAIEKTSVGRTFMLDSPRHVKVLPATPCDKLLAKKPKADLTKLGLSAVSKFRYSFLQSTEATTALTLDLKYLDNTAKVTSKIDHKSLVASSVLLADVYGFTDGDFADFQECCAVTGACGDYVLTSVYRMSRTSKAMELTEEKTKAVLKSAGIDKVSEKLANVQAMVEVINGSSATTSLESSVDMFTHFSHRNIRTDPPAMNALVLISDPSSGQCGTTVDMKIRVDNVALAGSSVVKYLGYDISAPADVTIASVDPAPAKLGTGAGVISCRPTSTGTTCPTTVSVKATLPNCNSIGDAGFRVVDWNASLALYPVDEKVGYRQRSEALKQIVTPADLKKLPSVSLSRSSGFAVAFGSDDHAPKSDSLSLDVDFGDLQEPKLAVVPPDGPFVQFTRALDANGKTVKLDISVAPDICKSYQMSKTFPYAVTVLLTGKKPGAKSAQLWELAPVNVNLTVSCPPSKSP